MEMKHYLFEDEECGLFLVGAYTDEEAWQIVKENGFEESEMLRDDLTEEEAENSGLDEW